MKEFLLHLIPPFLRKPAIAVVSFFRDPKYAFLYSKRFRGLNTEEIRYLLSRQYKNAIGHYPNFDEPKTLNEKINWLKLYYKDPLITECSDKVLFRNYISRTIGPQYLVPCIGVYDNPSEIDFNKLPNSFVAKVNWGSGQNIICKDKHSLDLKSTRKQLESWLEAKNNHYYDFFEWGYKDIKPKIIIEEFIESKDDLPDYKFFCYNGNPLYMFIAKDRQKGCQNLSFTFYDKDFNRLDVVQHYKTFPGEIEKPTQWEEMINLARKLSKPFPFARIDFYAIGESLKVGEITFYHFGGLVPFEPAEWDERLGSPLKLPEERS